MKAAGWSDSLRSKRLIVIEWHPTIDSGIERERTGTSSLLYVDPETLAVRTARIFDRKGDLVRIIESIEPAADGDSCHVSSFRVASPLTHTHTVYRFEQYVGDAKLDDSIFSEEGLLKRDGSVSAPPSMQ